MNKFVTILLAASVAVAAANVIPGGMDDETSELSLNPDDSAETEKLVGTNVEGFRDFCIRTRDTVVDDMKSRGNVFASDVFATIFKSIGDIAHTSADANKKATQKLGAQLRSPSADVDESSEEKVDQIIAEGQKAIKEAGNQPQGLFAAFMGGVKSFATAGYGEAIKKITDLQKQLGEISITENLIGFCEQLSDYEKQAIDIFEETKQQLVAEDAEQYKSVKYSDVAPKCITANRLSRAEGFCKFVLSAKVPLSKVFGFKLPGDSSEQ